MNPIEASLILAVLFALAVGGMAALTLMFVEATVTTIRWALDSKEKWVDDVNEE